MINKSPLMFD